MFAFTRLMSVIQWKKLFFSVCIVRTFLSISAISSSCNINAAWTIHSPWTQFGLYSNILFGEISFHLLTSASGKFWDTWEVGEGVQSRPEDAEGREFLSREVGNFEMPTPAVLFETPSNLRGSEIELSVASRSKRSFLELFLEALYIFFSPDRGPAFYRNKLLALVNRPTNHLSRTHGEKREREKERANRIISILYYLGNCT